MHEHYAEDLGDGILRVRLRNIYVKTWGIPIVSLFPQMADIGSNNYWALA
jgi:hypothetical protein